MVCFLELGAYLLFGCAFLLVVLIWLVCVELRRCGLIGFVVSYGCCFAGLLWLFVAGCCWLFDCEFGLFVVAVALLLWVRFPVCF